MPRVEDMFEKPEPMCLAGIFMQYNDTVIQSETMRESLQKLTDVARMIPRPTFARSIASDLVLDLLKCPDFSLASITQVFFEPPLAILFDPALEFKLEHLHTIYRSYIDEPQGRFWFSQDAVEFVKRLEAARTREDIEALMNDAAGSVRGVQDLVLLATGIRSPLLCRLTDPQDEDEYSDFFWAFARAMVMVRVDNYPDLEKIMRAQSYLPQSVIVLDPTIYHFRDPIPPIRGPISIVGTLCEPSECPACDGAEDGDDCIKSVIVIRQALKFEGPACLYNLDIRHSTQQLTNVCVAMDPKIRDFPHHKTIEIRHVSLAFGGLRFENGAFLDIQDLAVSHANRGLEVSNTKTVCMSTRANCREKFPLANTMFLQCETAYEFTEVGAVHMKNQGTERCKQVFCAGDKLIKKPHGWQQVTGILDAFEVEHCSFWNAHQFGTVSILRQDALVVVRDSMVSVREINSRFMSPMEFVHVGAPRASDPGDEVMAEEPLHVPARVPLAVVGGMLDN